MASKLEKMGFWLIPLAGAKTGEGLKKRKTSGAIFWRGGGVSTLPVLTHGQIYVPWVST